MNQIKRFNEDTIDAISTYLENGGKESGIELSEKHYDLLDKIRYADELIRKNEWKREQIANKIKAKYDVSRDTAYRYIVMAEKIFSSSYPLNKKSEISLRIDLLKEKINECYLKKDYIAAGVLERSLQKYYDMYPDYKEPRSPKNITFIINGGIHQTNNNLTIEQAEAKTDELIKLLEEKDDY